MVPSMSHNKHHPFHRELLILITRSVERNCDRKKGVIYGSIVQGKRVAAALHINVTSVSAAEARTAMMLARRGAPGRTVVQYFHFLQLL